MIEVIEEVSMEEVEVNMEAVGREVPSLQVQFCRGWSSTRGCWRSGSESGEISSEEDMSWSKHHRSSSQDRRNGDMRPGPGRAKSERDLSRVARVNLGSGGGSRDNVSTPVQQKQRTKMKTTTII